jgi:hypothetical protein
MYLGDFFFFNRGTTAWFGASGQSGAGVSVGTSIVFTRGFRSFYSLRSFTSGSVSGLLKISPGRRRSGTGKRCRPGAQ